MKNILLQVLIITAFICSQNAQSQVIDQTGLEARVDSLIPSNINDATPGLVVGIVLNGELIFSKGYGLANMSYGIPNDPKMVYNIGSVTKQFLGYAFAMLHVEGILNIDDPVSKYLDDWPEFDQTVSIRNLLSHTSGYREAYTISSLAGRIIGVDRLSREECLEVVRKQPQLEFTPGDHFTYNSTAWVILAEIFEKATGKAADEWVESKIFTPLGMTNTQIEAYVGEVMTNAAESYSFEEELGYTNEKSNRAIFGAADIYTSVEDLVKWVNNYRTAEIGGKEVNALFLDPFVLNDGTNSGYALGIGNGSYRGLKRYRHTGGHESFVTQLSYYPNQDLGIIVISNFGRKGAIPTTNIAELLLEEQMSSPADYENERINIKKQKLEKLIGLYINSSFNRTIELTMTGDTLKMDGSRELIPVKQNTFRMNGLDDQINFKTLSNGKTQINIIRSNSNTIYTSIDPWTASVNELMAIEGDYWSDELETVYHLFVENEQLIIQHRWLGNIPLKPIAADLFSAELGFFVKFVRNKDGNISGFNANSGRTLNVFFERK